LALEKTSNPEHGQLASSLCFELSKSTSEKPAKLAERLAEVTGQSRFSLIERVVPLAGYVNYHANLPRLAALTLESARVLDVEYGFIKTTAPLRVTVEHTSVNPLHPIHIGQARNPILGDSLSRLLAARGHNVRRHYYVDDVGRQSSVVAYGYDRIGRPTPDKKPDHFIGKIYTITSCIVEINRLKEELKAKSVQTSDEVAKANKELDDWVSIAAELESKNPELFEKLLNKIKQDTNPEEAINRLNRAYEEGNPEAKELIRKVSELCLQGFRQTLARVEVGYDSWDWESDMVWNGHVEAVLRKLQNSPYVFTEGVVFEFDAEKAVRNLDLKKKLGLKEDHEVPPLTLVRADGTTLYTTRDIAYTLWKFENADKVINVIGMEQSLAQLQLKIALHALGHREHAESLVHFAYNLVTLPGYKMSSRRGRYITLDDVMDEAENRAYEEVSKRSPQLSDKEKHGIARFVGIGAVRYALVSVDTAKPVVFTWDRVLNFERNSAPYVQYTHARAYSILRKAPRKITKPAYELLNDKLEHEIVLMLSNLPDTFIEAAEYLKPNLIAEYANNLADKFNTFYNALPVIKAEPQELGDARLALTDAVRIALRNTLGLIGVFAPEKM